MWYVLKLYIRDWWINIPLAFSLLILAYTWWYVASHVHPVEGGIILHYDVVIGPNLHGDWWRLYYFPLVSSGICLINQLLAYIFYSSDRILARVFSLSSTLLMLFLLVAVSLIVGINF